MGRQVILIVSPLPEGKRQLKYNRPDDDFDDSDDAEDHEQDV